MATTISRIRWMLIKQSFARAMPVDEHITASRLRKGERGIWQRRYWEHAVRDERNLRRCIDDIHLNPVKHGLVARVAGWPHSSFHRFVRDGRLPADWAGGAPQGGLKPAKQKLRTARSGMPP